MESGWHLLTFFKFFFGFQFIRRAIAQFLLGMKKNLADQPVPVFVPFKFFILETWD